MKSKRTSRERFEAYLAKQGWPYVVVDEVKKAIFSKTVTSPGAFHVLLYSSTGPNLLCMVRSRPTFGVDDRAVLAEWEKVFGDEFIGCVAWAVEGGPAGGLFAPAGQAGEHWRALTTTEYAAGKMPRDGRTIGDLL